MMDIETPKVKWTRVLYDFSNPGQVKTVECKDHSYAWSGSIPCTGIRKCIYCGKPENHGDMTNEKL